MSRFSDLLDRAELTQALELAWSLVRRLNRFVEETRPWELYNLVEGLRVTTLLLVPYLPRTSETLLAGAGRRGAKLGGPWIARWWPEGGAGSAALPSNRACGVTTRTDRRARASARAPFRLSGFAATLRSATGVTGRAERICHSNFLDH